MGTGEFSLTRIACSICSSNRSIGIVAGVVLGYLAALLIAHERWAFLAEYAPVVTLVAVIGAYFAADGLQASGFMAVFVFGIVLGNKDIFGFKMEPGEAAKARRICGDHRVHHAPVHLHPARRAGRFRPDGPVLARRHHRGRRSSCWSRGRSTVFLCALPDRRARWSFNEMLFMCWTRETGVIPAALAGLLLGMKAPGAQMIASVTFIAILMTILIQAPNDTMARQETGIAGNGLAAAVLPATSEAAGLADVMFQIDDPPKTTIMRGGLPEPSCLRMFTRGLLQAENPLVPVGNSVGRNGCSDLEIILPLFSTSMAQARCASSSCGRSLSDLDRVARRKQRWTDRSSNRPLRDLCACMRSRRHAGEYSDAVPALHTIKWITPVRNQLISASHSSGAIRKSDPTRAARRSDCGGWPKARMKARRIRSGSRKPVRLGDALDRLARGLHALRAPPRCAAARSPSTAWCRSRR